MLWLIRLIPIIILFLYASVQDYRHGEVSNKVWLYTPIGLSLLAVELYLSPHLLSYAVVSMVFTVVFSLGLFFVANDKFGPADAKALLMLGLCFPLTDNMIFTPMFCLGFAGLFVLIRRGRYGLRGLQGKIRLVPYLFIGLLTVLILPV